MNTRFATAGLIAAIATQAHGLGSPNYDLSYDITTGALSIDTGGGNLINYVLEGGSFDAAAHQTHLGGFASSYSHTLSESNIGSIGGVLGLGAVLDADLGLHDFAQMFSKATYVANLATPVTNFDIFYPVAPGSSWAEQAGSYDGYDLVYHEQDSAFQVIAKGRPNKSLSRPVVDLRPPDRPRLNPIDGPWFIDLGDVTIGGVGESGSLGDVTFVDSETGGLAGRGLFQGLRELAELDGEVISFEEWNARIAGGLSLVDLRDLAEQTVGVPGEGETAVTPEPSSALLMLGLSALVMRRRRADAAVL